MSFQDTRRAIESRFSANWTATAANRIKWENTPFEQPASGTWVALTIMPGDAAIAGIAATPLNRYAGMIQVDIYAPENSGTDASWALVDSVSTIFRHQQFSAGSSGTITARVPSVHNMGTIDGCHRLVVPIPLQRDIIE